MNKYEVMYVIDPALEDSARSELISYFSGIVEKNEGIIDRIDEWGKRRLAYEINDLTEGYYVLMNMETKPEFPAELERVMKITDGILRCLTTAVEE